MNGPLNKRQQARNEKILQDLVQNVPGNNTCADCQNRNPGQSWIDPSLPHLFWTLWQFSVLTTFLIFFGKQAGHHGAYVLIPFYRDTSLAHLTSLDHDAAGFVLPMSSITEH